jgi:hypothetical protein
MQQVSCLLLLMGARHRSLKRVVRGKRTDRQRSMQAKTVIGSIASGGAGLQRKSRTTVEVCSWTSTLMGRSDLLI